MELIELNKENFKTEVLDAKGTVVIDFWAAWCGPCMMLSPLVDEFAENHPEIKVCKLNVDDNQELAMEYKIMSIPTLLVFKDGEYYTRSIGAISKADMEELIV